MRLAETEYDANVGDRAECPYVDGQTLFEQVAKTYLCLGCVAPCEMSLEDVSKGDLEN